MLTDFSCINVLLPDLHYGDTAFQRLRGNEPGKGANALLEQLQRLTSSRLS